MLTAAHFFFRLTLVHEVGHWLGLQHTYDNDLNPEVDDPCHPSLLGDLVADTAVQLRFRDIINFTNATLFVDTCRNITGEDHLWNHMNSACSGRDCYGDRGSFTTGQILRMVSFISATSFCPTTAYLTSQTCNIIARLLAYLERKRRNLQPR